MTSEHRRDNRTDLKMTVRSSNLRLAFAVAVLPTIAYVLADFVFQLPDNGHEATFGLFLTIAALLTVWASSGYIAARTGSTACTRIIAGTVAGIVSVAILWLVAFALNDLFLERMSYEPDRIRAFQQSGYATLREWWAQERGWGPAPLLMGIAALAGAAGAAARNRTQRSDRITTT